jgi:hypothetical protein
VLASFEIEDQELPWEEYPEAIMEHSLDFRNSILRKLGHELKSLARWMKNWDIMVAKREWTRIQERGQSGQCRESNHINVCESWDPTDPNSKPKFIDEERRVAAVFYGAIMDWAASKGKGLEFWWSGDNARFTIILRAIRAIWGKEKCQKECCTTEKRISRTRTTFRSRCSHVCKNTFQF